MAIDPRILSCIEEIRRYMQKNEDLNQAHHFLYDKRNIDSEQVQFLVIGMNPGEPKVIERQFARQNGMPLEETSASDFIKEAIKKGCKLSSLARYMNRCARLCGTPEFALTESFFWSSYDTSTLNSRWFNSRAAHMEFCRGMNQQLIDIHEPRAVVFSGLKQRSEIIALYDLIEKPERTVEVLGHPIIFLHRDMRNGPWVFTKHLSARLRREELDTMRKFMAESFP